jgi:hypothetical protein
MRMAGLLKSEADGADDRRHCEPTDSANALPMTGSAKQSIARQVERWIASLAMTARKKAGVAPGLLFSWMAGSFCTKTRFALLPGHDDGEKPQFEARFGGEAGHDLISVS